MNALADVPGQTFDQHTGPPGMLLEVDDVCKSFGALKVLDGFSMQLFSGENVAIVGKSGSGKSVLLKCIIGLLPYDSGDIRVLGYDVSQLNQRQLDGLRTEVGFYFREALCMTP